MPTLLSWLDAPSAERGVRFARPDGSWEHRSYAELARSARQVAAALRATGIRRNDVVAVIEHNGPRFIAVLFGALLAGAVVTPVAPPARFRDRAGYDLHLAGLLSVARPAIVVAAADVIDLVAAHAATAQVRLVSTDALLLEATGGDGVPGIAPADLVLLQFTSGSTGRVRGVRIGYPALEANIAAIRGWLAMGELDATASWLPVHHDMGLVGCLLAPVVNGSDLWLMTPEEFVRRPLRYLRCFGRDGARLTAMPGFGLDHITRRVRPADLDGLDFSAWRAVILGAERLAPRALERFHALLAPHGLHRRALLPAYGLAEATLAVTGLPLAEEWTTATRSGDPVLGCGRPLPGVTVDILDEDGQPVPAGRTGEIAVGGRCVAAGYAGPAAVGPSGFVDGPIRTGDAGFLCDGQLFVVGRIGDGVKIRGRMVFAEDVETLVAAHTDAPAGRLVCLLGLADGVPTAVIVAEHVRPDRLATVPHTLRAHLPDTRVVLLSAPVGTVPRTSSGKPRRRRLWRDYLAGELAHLAGIEPADLAPAAVSPTRP